MSSDSQKLLLAVAFRNVADACSSAPKVNLQRPAPDNVKHISSVQEMVDELAAAREQLVVADFYAPWCGACRSLYPKLCKLAAENPDVVFLCVNFDESRMLVKGLNVKVLPYFHFYRGPEGRVAAFSASVSKVQLLRDAIAVHNTPRCALSDVFGLQEFPDVQPGRHVLSDAASAFAGEAAGLPSSTGEAPCDFCGPPQSGSESESDSSSGGSNGVGAGNGPVAEVALPPPIVAGPFDGDALMM
ncbi:hypothetical protein N2152v2_001668 [Parachlorella kessleri]